jgi:hypothetical protein
MLFVLTPLSAVNAVSVIVLTCALETLMRHILVPVAAALALFIMGIFILNTQLWYSARADSMTGAKFVVKNMNTILGEAQRATRKR